ncbi:MAG: metal ABC transporter ATP-binding protein [Bacillota bacterium]
MRSKLIEVENLSVFYGKQQVLRDISFIIYKGDYVGLVGANGSGKTTLVKAILGLVPVSNGSIKYFGSGGVHKGVGYLPQVAVTGNTLFPGEVHEIVAVGLLGNKKFPKRITKEDNERIDEILKRLDIYNLKHNKIGDLSGGQQQRVLLARAMVSSPKLLILDEPTSALDPKIRTEFFSLIKKINEEEGTSIILVSHDLSSIKKCSSKMMLLDREMLYYGPTENFNMDVNFVEGIHEHHDSEVVS